MRVPPLLCAVALLAGCQKPKDWVPTYPPDYLGHWSDRVKEKFPELQTVFGPSCLWRESALELDQCFRMEEPRRWSGLWRTGFEESRFCADGEWSLGGGYGPRALECDYETLGRRIWAEGRDESTQAARDFGLYRVEFIGRITKYPGGPYGHMGMSDYEIVIDRMISMNRIEPGLPEMSKGQTMDLLIAEEKRGTFTPSSEMKEKMQEHVAKKRAQQ